MELNRITKKTVLQYDFIVLSALNYENKRQKSHLNRLEEKERKIFKKIIKHENINL